MKRKIALIYLLSFGLSFVSYAQEHLEHTIWNKIVKENVTEEGDVNYLNIKKQEARLDSYLLILSQNHPTKNWERNDQLAFWINAYNAYTVKLIVKNYPVKSIKDLGGSIYKVNTAWDIKFITIGNETYDLNNIEHGIIRKDFADPRIHFAVNCASISCPRLRNEAYIGSKLEDQLDDQARYFINNATKNKISKKKAYLSKIFSWFSGDFKQGDNTVMSFINKYSNIKINTKTKYKYLDYDWMLNE